MLIEMTKKVPNAVDLHAAVDTFLREVDWSITPIAQLLTVIARNLRCNKLEIECDLYDLLAKEFYRYFHVRFMHHDPGTQKIYELREE